MKLPELREVVLKKVKMNLPPETQLFLADLTEFLLNSDYIYDEAKTYLVHDYWTFENVYNHPKYKGIPKTTLRYRLTYSVTKLNKAFGERMLLELIDFKKDCSVYQHILDTLKLKEGEKKLFRKQFIIPLPVGDSGDDIELSGESLQQIQEVAVQLKPYTHKAVGKVQANINPRVLRALIRVMESDDVRYEGIRSRIQENLDI